MKKVLLSLVMSIIATCSFAESYTLTFNETGSSSDSSSKITTASTIFTESCLQYVSEVTDVSDIYSARTGCGIKFGASKKAGKFTITLTNPSEVESIVFSAAEYNDKGEGATGFTVSDGGSQSQSFTLSAGARKFEDCTWTPTGTVTTITITQNQVTSGRFYMNAITINAKGDTPTPEPEPEPEPTYDVDYTTTCIDLGLANFDFTSNGTFELGNTEKINNRDFTAKNLTVTASVGTGKTQPAYYTSGDAIRLYGGNTFTISSKNTILRVEYTWDVSSSKNPAPTAETCTVTDGYDFTPYAIDEENKTETYVWTGEANEVVLTNPASSGHFRLKSVVIKYDVLGEDDEAAADAKADFMNELRKVYYSRAIMERLKGVNPFMYAPAALGQFDDEIAEIVEKVQYHHTDEGVFESISQLRQVSRSISPLQPGVNDMFLLKHNSGKYLSISDGVALVDEADAAPIQFHNVALDTEVDFVQKTEIGVELYHSMYIYNTPERKYLGFKRNNFNLTDNALTQWYIITTPYGYGMGYINANTGDSYLLIKDAKTGELTLANEDDLEDLDYVTEAYCWNILNYVAPETPATDPEEGDAEATAISGTSTVAAPVAVYSANGARIQSMQKGINIVKMADGTVKKVIK